MKVLKNLLCGCSFAGLIVTVKPSEGSFRSAQSRQFFVRCEEDDNDQDASCPGENSYLMFRNGGFLFDRNGECRTICASGMFATVRWIMGWRCGPCKPSIIDPPDLSLVFVGGDTDLAVQNCDDSTVLLSGSEAKTMKEIPEAYLNRFLWSDFSPSNSDICSGGCKSHIYRRIDAIKEADTDGVFSCDSSLTCAKISTSLATLEQVMKSDDLLDPMGLLPYASKTVESAFEKVCNEGQTDVPGTMPDTCDVWHSTSPDGQCIYTNCSIGMLGDPDDCIFADSRNSCGPAPINAGSAAVNEFIPENVTGIFNFSDTCCSHDHCYSSVFNKSQCDLSFLVNSLLSCDDDEDRDSLEALPVSVLGGNLTCEISAILYFLEVAFGEVETYNYAKEEQAKQDFSFVCSAKSNKPVFVGGDTDLSVENCDDSTVLLSGPNMSEITQMTTYPHKYTERALWSDFSPSNGDICAGGCRDHLYRWIDAIEEPEDTGPFSCDPGLKCAKVSTSYILLEEIMDQKDLLEPMGLLAYNTKQVELVVEQVCEEGQTDGPVMPIACDAWYVTHTNGKCSYTNCFVGLTGDPDDCIFDESQNSCGPAPITAESAAVNDFITENVTGVFDFSDTCCSHDNCYSSVFNKSQCDLAFLKASLLSCSDNEDHTHFEGFPVAALDSNLTCEIAAILYFLEASLEGADSYDHSQKEQLRHDLSSTCSEVGDEGPRRSAYVFGDPHYVTFDGLAYDCQGHGEFILLRSLGEDPLEMHVFSVGVNDHAPTVARGISIVERPETPTVQISLESFGTNGECSMADMEVYFDGIKTTIQSDETPPDLEGASAFTAPTLDNLGVSVIYADATSFVISYTSSGLKVIVALESHSTFDCYLNVHVSLPETFTHFNKVVGLLGSPNDDTTDEWHTPQGVTVPLTGALEERLFQEAYDYCTDNWCISDPSQSFFVFDSSLEYLFNCDADFTPFTHDLNTPGDDLFAICGGNRFCLVDGLSGGFKDALVTYDSQSVLETEKASASRFQFCPKLVQMRDQRVSFKVSVNVQGLIGDDVQLDRYKVYRLKENGLPDTSFSIFLFDNGQGVDDSAADLIFSGVLPLLIVGAVVPDCLGFMAVPVIDGFEDDASPLVFADMSAVWTSFGEKLYRIGSHFPHKSLIPASENIQSSLNGGVDWGPAYAVDHPWIHEGEDLAPSFVHANSTAELGTGQTIWYRILFELPDPLQGNPVLVLKLKADNLADVIVNDYQVYTEVGVGQPDVPIMLSPEALSPHLKAGDNELKLVIKDTVPVGGLTGFQYWMEVTYNDYTC